MDVTQLVCTILGTSSVCTFLQWLLNRFDKKKEKNSILSKAVLGLLHDRLLDLCERHIKKGEISADELEDLNKYLYEPYVALGGNGTVKKLMTDVTALPINTRYED